MDNVNQKKHEDKIERLKILLRDFGCNLLELDECYKYNSQVNLENIPSLEADKKKIAEEIKLLSAELREAKPVDGIVKTFSKQISRNVTDISLNKRRVGNNYYYNMWKDIVRDKEEYIGRKRSVGVIIFSVLFILQGIMGIGTALQVLANINIAGVDVFRVIFGLALGIFGVTIGIGLFKLINYARLGAIALYSWLFIYMLLQAFIASFFKLQTLIPVREAKSLLLTNLFLLAAVIFFFTRSKVKKQFEREECFLRVSQRVMKSDLE